MKYVISEEAARDLEQIWVYTNEMWSSTQADAYLNMLFDEIESITKSPLKGKDFSHIIEGYFQSSVKSHFIFYKLNNSKKEVYIIRILHHRMDIANRLLE
jgi:toxin ParE1/3/4